MTTHVDWLKRNINPAPQVFAVRHRGAWSIARPSCSERPHETDRTLLADLALCWVDANTAAIICFSGDEDEIVLLNNS